MRICDRCKERTIYTTVKDVRNEIEYDLCNVCHESFTKFMRTVEQEETPKRGKKNA